MVPVLYLMTLSDQNAEKAVVLVMNIDHTVILGVSVAAGDYVCYQQAGATNAQRSAVIDAAISLVDTVRRGNALDLLNQFLAKRMLAKTCWRLKTGSFAELIDVEAKILATEREIAKKLTGVSPSAGARRGLQPQ